ncbi:MAG: LPS export ABC transporter periplasmic protein LptC [Xanthomonadales bacterium]|nr:LPS export ABC transporter periplasmic protein LptC [Xanthomonadales bacterium]
MRPPSRFGYGAVLLAVGLLLGTFLLRQYWLPDEQPKSGPKVANMDFEARDLSVVRYDPDGAPGFDLWAPRAERQRAEDALTLIDANFVLADAQGKGSWQGQAPTALVSNDGSAIQMRGGVMLERPQSKTQLHTEAMAIDPQARRAWGEHPVKVERVGSVVEGGQFSVDLNGDLVSLDCKVRGRFANRP